MEKAKADQLKDKLKEANIKLHGARLNFMSRFIMAMMAVRTVSLSRVASVLNGAVEIASNEKRIKRFFSEVEIEGEWLAKCVLTWLPKGPYLLSLDRTNWKLGSIDINILMLGVVYKGMAFPLLWTVLPHAGNSNTTERLALIDRLLEILGHEDIEALVADREFTGKDWFEGLKERRISFVMRLRNNTLIGCKGRNRPASERYKHLKEGEVYVHSKRCRVLGNRLYIAVTRAPDGELVVVATTSKVKKALERYAKRWGIETLFGALKRRGFNLEDTHVSITSRLDTLLALLTLAFTWAYLLGIWLHEQRPLKLKKHGYAPKSIFRRGFEFLQSVIVAVLGEAKYSFSFCLHVLSP